MFIFDLADIVGIGFIALFVLINIIIAIKKTWRQSKCKHNDMYENNSCDLICRKCGKNLGFIGSYKKK